MQRHTADAFKVTNVPDPTIMNGKEVVFTERIVPRPIQAWVTRQQWGFTASYNSD